VNKIVLLLTTILLSSCSGEPRFVEREVDAIYWHEYQRYTAMTENAGMIEKHNIPPWGTARAGAVKLYTDVDANTKAWYKCDYRWSNWVGANADASCEIHIHNLDELGTADWNHGKFGSGPTTRID